MKNKKNPGRGHRVLFVKQVTQGFVTLLLQVTVPLLVLPKVALQIVQVIVVPETFTYTDPPACPKYVSAEELEVPNETEACVLVEGTPITMLYTPAAPF